MTEGSQNDSFIGKIFSKIPFWELSFVFIIFIVVRYLPENINAISLLLDKPNGTYFAIADISLKGLLIAGSFGGICWRSKYFKSYYFSQGDIKEPTENPSPNNDNIYEQEIRDATEKAAKRR